ncbi:unnamed protein product [Clonostachys rosea]|uniref:AAA+ ATPase domain-containing protein n=1 Tax=Bionectria ochroleuca TaxID=29856 RepID=A0ABY6UDJ8_BIOOC|nr:unnamed protein product [Clonostachys rosea]
MYKDTQALSLGTGNETVPPELLFLSMEGLESRLTELKASIEKDKRIQHAIFEIEACKEFVEVEFSGLIKKRNVLLAENKITFETLWSILPPKTLLFSKDEFDQPRVFRLESHEIERKSDGSYVMVLDALYTESDGKQIGVASAELAIPQFEGAVYIASLPAYPVIFHPDRSCLKKILVRRGKKQLKFHARGHQLREHQGFALMENESSGKFMKFRTHGRIIVDAATLEELKPSNRMIPTLEPAFPKPSARYHFPDPFTNTLEPICQSTDGEEGDAPPEGNAFYLAENMPDIAIIMLSGRLYGYSLGDSEWATFAVSRVSKVIWDRNIIKSLEMVPEAKTLLYNLIKAHSRSDSGFDDIVKDKGKGLVGLLIGPPGVGKTLTAEAVAETAQLPLFVLSCGGLGSNSVEINKNLRHFLELASRWKAVLLLDEADVYLARRNDNDLERNAIISVFLREIEYYTGILILTTNRAKKIDSAFQSRIHFCHRYRHHNPDSRKRIWESFVSRSQLNDKISVQINDEGLDELAKLNFNGREVKSCCSRCTVRSSRDLANSLSEI